MHHHLELPCPTSFHDAVENYLGIVTQHLRIDVNKAPEFIAYWALLKPEFKLPKKDSMKRLNDARVALKHKGAFPSEHQVEQARQTVDDFFTTVTPKVFGVDFDSIDTVDLLTQPEVVRLVREASNPAHLGGAIDRDAADKAARFLQLCDAFGLPV
ncbi:carboxyl transferase domain-containing protein, partial [Streptomyces sp. NPDC001617]